MEHVHFAFKDNLNVVCFFRVFLDYNTFSFESIHFTVLVHGNACSAIEHREEAIVLDEHVVQASQLSRSDLVDLTEETLS